MPYEIKKSGEGYKVFKKGTSKEFSKEPMSHKKAEAQLKALYANTNEGKSNTMKKSELTKMIGEIIKEVISEQTNTTPKHKIIAQLMGPDFFLSKKPENTWDEKDHDVFNRISKMASKEGKVPKISEADMFVTGGSINPELRKKVEQFVKSIAKYYDYSIDDAFLAIMTILKGGIAKEGVSESVDYDTAVAYRLTVPGNRDEAMINIKALLDNLTTGKSKKFPEVKVTMLPSKGNPNDLILKLNGPGAFSMSKDIKARPELKGVKISKYTPQLTKIS